MKRIPCFCALLMSAQILRAADAPVRPNIVLVMADDQGWGDTGTLRGSKGTMGEGGLRVPGIVEWPARIPRPFVNATPCSTLDIYPTILAATGAVTNNQIQPLDGINLLPLFERQNETRAKFIPFWNHAGADYAGAPKK